MGEKMIELKNWLKSAGIEIRILKNTHKDNQRNHKFNIHTLYDLNSLQREYRHKHIAYSELRGKTRDQIEKPRQGNEPSESLIQKFKDEYREEETICISAQRLG